MNKIIQKHPKCVNLFKVTVLLLCLSFSCRTMGLQRLQKISTAASQGARQRAGVFSRQISSRPNILTHPSLSTPYVEPSKTPWQPWETPEEYKKKRAIEDTLALPAAQKQQMLNRINLKDVFDAYHDRNADLAQAVLSDAINRQKFAKGLAEAAAQAPGNMNLAELAISAKQDAVVADMEQKTLIGNFQTLAEKGDNTPKEILALLKKTEAEETQERLKAPIATSWDEQYAQWVESLQERDQSIVLEEKQRLLFNKVFINDIAQASNDFYLAKSILLAATEQEKIAKALIEEAKNNPGSESLAKLAEFAKKNAFAAELKRKKLLEQITLRANKGDKRALHMLSELIGKKEAEPKKEEPAKSAETGTAQQPEPAKTGWMQRIRQFFWGKQSTAQSAS